MTQPGAIFIVMRMGDVVDEDENTYPVWEVVRIQEGERIPEAPISLVYHTGVYRTAKAAFDGCLREVRASEAKRFCSYSYPSRTPMTRSEVEAEFEERIAESSAEYEAKMRLYNSLPGPKRETARGL